MRIRRIAVLIDGGFFIKRLPALIPPQYRDTPAAVADSARLLCKRHVQRLTGESAMDGVNHWLDHVYRLFYYDARPFSGTTHHPFLNRPIQFSTSKQALFREELFRHVRKTRKFALRLGHVVKEDGWRLRDAQVTKRLLRMRDWIPGIKAFVEGRTDLAWTPEQRGRFEDVMKAWQELSPEDVHLGLRQKGVDMRIGLDISTLTLKKQVDTIVLVTGDSDFVPAAKLARREGVEFLLDPLWQSVKDDLHEHVDGIVSGFPRPGLTPSAEDLVDEREGER